MNIAEMRKEFKQWSNETYCLKAVENDGDALRYVKEQKVFESIITNLGLES
ncbi:MAG: hypothetical protein WC331_11310 [Candidatus Omnitrophota bacterium]|jgi:hypothetical protein